MKKKLTKVLPTDKLFIYATNAVNLLSINEGVYKDKWLEIQKSSNKDGTFIYAWKIYSIEKDLGSDNDYVCEIYSLNNKRYLVKRTGEIVICDSGS